ncbi:TIGR00269 family protein [Candidatus Bathyarchaeota archaeon]|nr:TIGR00269 family protein [Candidatus Bathyarchaeota archaeon]
MTLCTFCQRRDASFFRHYSGENLCNRCFCKSIEDKVRKTISKYEMLNQKDRIMFGISGGKDSVTLLHILAKIEKAFPDVYLLAGTVDEGICHYREEALKIAHENCRKLGIEQVVTSFKKIFGYNMDEIVKLIQKKKKNGLTPCSYCGVLRRKALNILARDSGANKLVIAHNLDDETQTMLLNIFHGDPFRIVRSKPVLKLIHPMLIQRVKPMCLVPEKEVVMYAYLKDIQFQCMNCPYAQFALRNDIRNMLNGMEHKHPGTLFTIYSSMEKIRKSLENTINEKKLKNCKKCGEPTVNSLCRPCQMLEEISVF